ncbi:MAG: nucleotide exchange factor GrpE [Opitutaceae bacterium]|nr:nucleotide exchange factor GrpE [Opitutaceae bacterium]
MISRRKSLARLQLRQKQARTGLIPLSVRPSKFSVGCATSLKKPGSRSVPLADLAAQLATAKKEVADNYDRFMRTAADLENLRKRTLREKEELRLFSASRVLEDLLPVMDNLALGLTAAKQPNADLKTLTGGVDMVLTQFKSALGNHGLKEIHPAGQPFDPHQHEALSHAPSPEVKAEHVLNVIRTGYSLNGRLLRPASVIVSSGPTAAAKETVI